MVDTPQESTTPAAAPAVDTPTPATENPTPEAAPDTPVAPPAEAPASDPAKPETPAPEAPAEAPVESVLGDEKPKEGESKVADEKKDATKAEEGKDGTGAKEEAPTEIKSELPVFEDFKLPEGISLDKEPLAEFGKILGEIETGKLDHKGYQEAGQKLVDLAVKGTTDSINRLNDYYTQYHENQKKEWFEAFKKDPEMGGENLDTTVGMLRDAVENFGGTAEQIKEFRQVMKETGVGNHPSVTRILYNMQKKIDSYTKESTDNRIVPGQRPAPSKVKDYQRFYTGSNG